MHLVSEWTETVAGIDNATATAMHPAPASNQCHYVTSISASFSAAVAGKLLTLKDGNTVIGNYYVHNQRDIPLPKPLRMTNGNAVSLVLAASGVGGQLGAVTLKGFTR